MAIRAISTTPQIDGGILPALRRTRQALAARRRRLADEAARRTLTEFRDHYFELVELVCDAAYVGVEPWMEDAYVSRTRWFRDRYERIRAHAAPFVVDDAADIWEGRRRDSFEMLFVPSTLAALLEADGGELIRRLGRNQTALEQWLATLPRFEDRN